MTKKAKRARKPARVPGGTLFTLGTTEYTLVRELGAGAYGEGQLLARSCHEGRAGAQVLVKVLGHLEHSRERQRLEEEVQLAARLAHPAIARVHGLHEAKGGLYAVLEHVEGRSLESLYTDALLCGRYCSERLVLYAAAEVAAALHHAHTRADERGRPLGIVHGDLHPERIWLGPSGQVKLVDFGLALSRLEGRLASALPRVRGPAVYAAPEQLLQLPVDARADLFALGLVMLELLSGQHLLEMTEEVDLRQLGADLSTLPPDKLELLEKTVEELARLQNTGKPQEGLEVLAQRARSFDFREVERIAAREVPEPTRFILHKLLRREPDERYATAAELEQALRERLQVLGPYGAHEAAEEALLLEAEASGLTAVPEDMPLAPLPALAHDAITTPST